MKKIIVLSLVLLAMFSSLASAAVTVFMKNGETIEARRAWREGETVYILVNRDILLDFPKNEVDLRKTRVKNHPRSSQLLDNVLKVTAMRRQIESFTSSIEQSEGGGSAGSDEVMTMMKETFSPAEAWKIMRQEMARNLDEKTLNDVLQWYKSPTGSKAARIESENDPDRKQKMEEFLDQEATEESKAKFELAKQIEKVEGLSEFEVRLAKRMMNTMIAAVPGEIRNSEKMREQMKAVAAGDNFSLEKVRRKNVATLAYLYRDLTVDEVKEILEFQRSPSGSKFCRVSIRGIDKVMDRFMVRFQKKFHTALVELMKSRQ